MIRGFFRAGQDGAAPRPYAPIALTFPDHDQPDVIMETDFLIDTGSDLTILAKSAAELIGLDLPNIGVPGEIGGVGGNEPTWMVQATLSVQDNPTYMTIHVPQDDDQIPSLLGRDFMSAFTLIIRERDGAALLLDDDEADALNLPA